MDQRVKEEIEWCDMWWEQAPDEKSPRILLIGDSITRSYTPTVSKLLKGTVNLDRIATSYAINDPEFPKAMKFMTSEYKHTLIHLNNGLHGWHLDDGMEEYGKHLRAFTLFLKELEPNAKILFTNTTAYYDKGNLPTLCTDRNPRVLKRNESAAAVMAEFEIPVNDLYRYAVGKKEWLAGDAVHYGNDGAQALGEQIAGFIKSNL